MDALINNLRNKSEAEKKRWVKILAIVTTALLVIIWIVLRYVLFVPPERSETNNEPSAMDSINTIYEDSVNQFDTLRNDPAANVDFFPDFSVPLEETTLPPETESGSQTIGENQVEFETEIETESDDTPETETEPQTEPTDFFNS